MHIKQIIFLSILMPALFICGCAHPTSRPTLWQSIVMALPEEIYVWPDRNSFKHSRVGICRFGEPACARGTGNLAVGALVDTLLKMRVFSYVGRVPGDGCEAMACDRGPAGMYDYDLMITGDVTHYMDGSDFMAAHVRERISVVHVPTGRILWSASAHSLSEPVPSRDYILFQGRGAPAGPTRDLMQRNAVKFSNMLLARQVRTGHGGQQANKPLLRVHRAALEESRKAVKHLEQKNDLLEQQLLKAVIKGKALEKEVDDLSVQADELEFRLKEEIQKGEITLKRHKTKTIINIDDRICFDSGSAVLKRGIKRSLKKISETLKTFPYNPIRIEGHTDNRPIRSRKYPSNWELSSSRALAVLRFLADESGVDPQRLSAAGYGQHHPVAPNVTAKDRRLNRRVDIVILPADA